MSEKAVIFNIQRFSVNDGPGIRTTVFMKGCPLRCIWCHNPESYLVSPVLLLNEAKCIGCLDCVSACERGLHSFSEDGVHTVNRSECTACGACVRACTGALSISGRIMSASEVMDEVLRDRAFYKNSGGGMTLSGGEPLMNADFSKDLFSLARENGISTAVETSGFARESSLEKIIPYTDIFLFDFKESDPERHRAYTGVSNEVIIKNLQRLDSLGKRIILRCPIIPGYNDREEHLRAIAAVAEELSSVERVDVEPYHPLGVSKRESMGQMMLSPDIRTPTDDEVRHWIEIISEGTGKHVRRG